MKQLCTGLAIVAFAAASFGQTSVPDTKQLRCYDTKGEVAFPAASTPFAGQDAQHVTELPAYRDNKDGTVTDLVTGLIWQKTPDFQTRRSYDQAKSYADQLVLAGKSDWRLPTIKELYSLIDFRGSSAETPPRPYIDTRFFDFEYPPASSGLRLIDAQYWSSTEYVGTTMNNDPTVFGVNFADGRIKGYPRLPFFARYVRCVRGPKGYGENRFVDNKDGTITDQSTGLIWQKVDSGKGPQLAGCSRLRGEAGSGRQERLAAAECEGAAEHPGLHAGAAGDERGAARPSDRSDLRHNAGRELLLEQHDAE
jgi:hypothetical protein